jgi:lipid II:glycine glycyltransferase (peptidoglycan interpeptide bridge formation enzyme)
VRVGVTTPADRQSWEQVLASDPRALVTQTPAWLDCLCDVGGYADASRLYELADGRRLVLPLARRVGAGGIASQASLPESWGFGGPVAEGGLQPGDAEIVLADLAGSRALRTSVRPNPLDAQLWEKGLPPGAIAVPRLAHVLDLEGGFDRVWADRFTSHTRRSVQKAERSNLTVECDTTGRLVPVYYGLYERSLERWADTLHEPLWLARLRARRRDPQRKIEALARALGASARVWVASLDGRPAAAILVLQGANAHYTRGAMDRELAAPTRANQLLHRLAIEDACRAGCRAYHMGESGTSSGLARFKEGFGARPYPYAEYHLERLPITATDRYVRSAVKRAIGFREAR